MSCICTMWLSYLTLLPTGFSVFPSYEGGGGGFLAHIEFYAGPFNRFDSNLVHFFNLSKKITNFLAKMDASFSCYHVIKFENFHKDLSFTSSKWNCCNASIQIKF